MEESEKNINENDENQPTRSAKSDDDIFLVNKLGKYPDEFPVFPEEPSPKTQQISNKSDESTEEIQDTPQQEETIWDHYDSLESQIFDEPKPDISETIESEKLKLDNEFMQFLSEELERSSKKKPQLEEMELREKFVPVEEKGNYELIDLSKFPEQTSQEQKEEQKTTEVKQKESIDENDSSSFQETNSEIKDGQKADEVKEKKKRKMPIWLMITSVAVIVFAIATILSYNTFRKSQIDNKSTKKTASVEKPKQQQSSKSQSSAILKDTNKLIQETTVVDTLKKENVKRAESTILSNKTKTETNPPIAINKEKNIVKTQNTKVEIAPKKEIKEEQQIKEKTILVENRQNLKESNLKIATNIENAIYTIQVYSTPSREDAEQWKKKLESLNIPKAYISEQKIRDVIWYRVRFGEYPTREQAIQAAKQLGFSQMWVDRIK